MIETAVVPAAGYGSRMRPLTIAVPKEMFPLGRIPIIEHTIIELVASGINRICIVIRKDKKILEEYLVKRRNLYKEAEIHFVFQEAPLGIGDAILRAKDFLEAAPFVMAIPDQILLSEQPATKQLLDASKQENGIWNSMIEIPKAEMIFFRGARAFDFTEARKDLFLIKGISSNETSRVRGFGRTLFLPEVLDYMTEEYANDETGEVDLLKTFHAITKRFRLYGMLLKGKPCDLGTWKGYYYYQPLFQKFRPQGEDSA
jgi:UTP--glucose-1-phosphate uridylyltransferase